MNFSIKDLVTFTEEILNGKLHFSCSEYQLVAFHPLRYYFEETIGFDKKASFARLQFRLSSNQVT